MEKHTHILIGLERKNIDRTGKKKHTDRIGKKKHTDRTGKKKHTNRTGKKKKKIHSRFYSQNRCTDCNFYAACE